MTGEVKAGLSVNSGDDGKDATDDTTAKAWNQDAERAYRIRTTFGYAGDWGGAKVRLQADGNAEIVAVPAGANPATMKPDVFTQFAYGWADFLEKKVVVYGGLAMEDLWGLGKLSANVFDPSLDGVTGLRVAVNPIPELSIGWALPYGAVAKDIGDVFGSSVFGALYKSTLVSGAFGVALNPATDAVAKVTSLTDLVWTDSDEDGEFDEGELGPAKVAGTGTVAYDSWARILLGLEVNPVDVLKIVVDADIDTRKLQDNNGKAINNKTGYIRIGPLVQFTSGKLVAHARGDITVQNDGYGKALKKGTDLTDLRKDTGTFRTLTRNHAQWVNVKNLGDTSIAFRVGAAYQATETLNAYLQVGSDNVSWFAGNGLYVKPGLKITLGTASIEIFDKLGQIGADDTPKDVVDTLANPVVGVKAHSPFTNQFQIDFNWSF